MILIIVFTLFILELSKQNLAWSFGEKIYPTDASGATYIPTVQKPSGKSENQIYLDFFLQ